MQDLLAAEEAERWLSRGVDLLAQRKLDQVFACFEKGLQVAPHHANLQYYVGLAYEWGHGIPEDYGRAALWYRKAADQGFAPAQSSLGVMYGIGQGVAKDDAEAAMWFRKAADQGFAAAQYNLGIAYGTGQGVAKDDAEAAMWFRKAADQGFAPAQTILDSLHQGGSSVK